MVRLLPNRRIVNVDVDGVLYPFTEAMLLEAFVISQGRELAFTQKAKGWDFDAWGAVFTDGSPVPTEILLEAFHDGVIAGRVFRFRDPFPGAHDALVLLRERGWLIRLVTARIIQSKPPEWNRAALESTAQWIYEHDIPFDDLVVVSNTAKKLYPADAVIDDRPTFDWYQEGAVNVWFDSHEIPPSPRSPSVIRVETWAEIPEILGAGYHDETDSDRRLEPWSEGG